MGRQYNKCPEYSFPVLSRQSFTQGWYQAIAGLFQGLAPGAETSVAATGSPFVFKAPSRGFLIVSGGTVSSVTFTRNGTYVTGQTSGTFPLSLADSLTITYSAAPTLTFVPT